MDQDRTEVFDQEHCAPSDLRTEIFDVDCALVAETCRRDAGAGGIGESSAVATFCDAETVDGEGAAGADFGVDDGEVGVGGDGDFGGKFGNWLAWKRFLLDRYSVG